MTKRKITSMMVYLSRDESTLWDDAAERARIQNALRRSARERGKKFFQVFDSAGNTLGTVEV